MIIGFTLIYAFILSRIKLYFSRGKKLLHVFWNTLYMYRYIDYMYVLSIYNPDFENYLGQMYNIWLGQMYNIWP